MATDVYITRRKIKRNYFQEYQEGGGYATSPVPPVSVPIHEEWGYLDDIATDYPTGEVAITFKSAFPQTPITIKLEVYRYSEQMTNKYQRIPVFFDYGDDNDPIKTTGFTIYIDSSIEPLAGIIIEYGFREYNS